jgi:hypothetical protein
MRSFPLNDFVTEYARAFGLEVAEGNPFRLLKKGKVHSPISFPYRFAHLPISSPPKNTFHLMEGEDFHERGFSKRLKKTYVVNLLNDFSWEEQVVKRMKKFPKAAEFSELPTFKNGVELLAGTAKRKGFYVEEDWEGLNKLWAGMEGKGRLKTWGILEGGDLKAVQLMIEGDEGWAFTYFVGTTAETRPWSTWLMGKILEKYQELGFHSVDLLGANLPTVAQFKKGFGGQMVSYVEYCRKPWWRRLV